MIRNVLDRYEENEKVFLKNRKEQKSVFKVLKMLSSQIKLWVQYKHN